MLSKKQYRAEPADIFSCGIVLTAMLAGGMSACLSNQQSFSDVLVLKEYFKSSDK